MALTTNLISYWKMDDASGGIVDAHGANDGTEAGNPTYEQAGKINYAIDFDGTGDWFDTADAPFDITNKLSISVWIKPSSVAAQAAIISKYYLVYAIGQYKNLAFFCYINGNQINSTTTAVVGTWYHMVMTYDENGGANNLKFYINGDFETAGTVVGAIATNAYDLCIGARANNHVTPFLGLIDEVGIWDRVLTPDEITALYNSGNGLAYPFAVGTNMKINISDVFKDVDSIQINIGDAWKDVISIQQNIGDVWKDVY